MDFSLLFEFIFLAGLLCLSAFFSGSETGLFSLSSVRIHRLMEEKRRGILTVSELLKEPRNLLATILLLNLFVTVLSASLGEGIASHYFGSQGLEICIVVMSLIILVFCEITPKVLAVAHAERVSLLAAPLLTIFMRLSAPVRILFLKVANEVMSRLLPQTPVKKEVMGLEQMMTAVDMGHQDGILSPEETAMLKGILELKDKVVKHVMTPREDIYAFEIGTPLLTIYEEIRKRKLSRVPIYQGSLDQIAGVLYSKDLIIEDIVQLRAIQVIDLLRKPCFVFEDLGLDDLLRNLRNQRLHMAVVLDSGKRVSGIVTLDDIMEVVVGDSVS